MAISFRRRAAFLACVRVEGCSSSAQQGNLRQCLPTVSKKIRGGNLRSLSVGRIINNNVPIVLSPLTSPYAHNTNTPSPRQTVMCGRARCSCPASAVAAAYGVPPARVYGGDQFQPRHNLHPGHKSPVIVRERSYKRYQPHHQAKQLGRGKEGKGGEGKEPAEGGKEGKEGEEDEDAKAVVVMHWGLIPSWHKEGEKLEFFRAFNARSETVDSKPMFRRLVDSKRCIVSVVRNTWNFILVSIPPFPPFNILTSHSLSLSSFTHRRAFTSGRR